MPVPEGGTCFPFTCEPQPPRLLMYVKTFVISTWLPGTPGRCFSCWGGFVVMPGTRTCFLRKPESASVSRLPRETQRWCLGCVFSTSPVFDVLCSPPGLTRERTSLCPLVLPHTRARVGLDHVDARSRISRRWFSSCQPMLPLVTSWYSSGAISLPCSTPSFYSGSPPLPSTARAIASGHLGTSSLLLPWGAPLLPFTFQQEP